MAGSLVQWLRDNLGMIVKSSDIGKLASTVEDNGGVYFVPAFSGLFAPYWRSDARGAIVGLTRYVNKGHIARAVEESTAFQSAEVLDAILADATAAPSWSNTRAFRVALATVSAPSVCVNATDVCSTKRSKPTPARPPDPTRGSRARWRLPGP